MTSARPLARSAPPTATQAELASGLGAAPAHISPKYFYDSLGSRLFEAITGLPEYYPTRTELAILRSHAAAIAQRLGEAPTLIELGAGNCEKAAILLQSVRAGQYVALDISADFLREAVSMLQAAHAQVPMLAVSADLSGDLHLPATVVAERRQFLYLGSSIGNFDPEEAAALLRRIHARCGSGGGLLIGIDLVKPAAILEAAYDDALGVTAAFNLNVLNAVNAELGSDFDPRQWQHRALFNPTLSRVEMHLEARRDVVVRWGGMQRRFGAGERIHTENSYKYRPEDFEAMLVAAGFREPVRWTDGQKWFALFHAKA